jgi:SAM-dependent methyltransferase
VRAARQFYERDAERRMAFDGTDPVVRRRNEFVVSLLAPGDRCLDVGCGAGGFGPLLATRFRRVIGVDLSQPLARAARGRGVLAVCGDLDEGALPYAENTFDAAVCCDVLEHVFDPVLFLERVRRVLRPGGQFVLSVPNIRYWPRLKSLMLGYFPRTTGDPCGYDGGHLHYFATQNVLEVLRAASFASARPFGFNADSSRRARPVSWSLQTPLLRGLAREFGCSTIIAEARK